jgi:hypothetical protein
MTRLSAVGQHVLACFAVLIGGYASLSAQCPQYTHSVGSKGVTSWGLETGTSMVVNVVTVNNSLGSLSSTSAESAISTAIDGIIGVMNPFQVGATVTNTNNEPSGGTVTNPLEIVELGTQEDINLMGVNCTGKPACTQWNYDNQGHTYYSLTYILPSVISNNILEPVMTHEFGHPNYGFQDCSGSNCDQSIMGLPVTPSSPTKPTPCDKTEWDNSECSEIRRI